MDNGVLPKFFPLVRKLSWTSSPAAKAYIGSSRTKDERHWSSTKHFFLRCPLDDEPSRRASGCGIKRRENIVPVFTRRRLFDLGCLSTNLVSVRTILGYS